MVSKYAKQLKSLEKNMKARGEALAPANKACRISDQEKRVACIKRELKKR